MSIQESQPAREAYDKGDYTTSINSLKSLTEKAPTKTERGRLQLLLASNLVARNQGDDFVEGARLYLQITNDYSIDAWIRALALKNIAHMVLVKPVNFYTSTFTTQPLNTLLPSSGSDRTKLNIAYLKILQLSDETYPTSGVEYTIAGSYYAPQVQNNYVAQDELKNVALLMQKYVAEGDTRQDQQFYSSNGLLLNYLNRARAIWVSSTILKNKTNEEQENAFKKALLASDEALKSSKSAPVEAAALATRFYYAAFLLETFGNTRSSDIQELLKSFSAPVNSAVRFNMGLLGSLHNQDSLSYAKITAIKLANSSKELGSFLDETGVRK